MERLRSYACILYPESLPDDWESVLEGLHVPLAISPLHDADVMDDGTPKKPHYHVLLVFSGKKSVVQVLDMLSDLKVSHVEPVHDCRAYARYLAHMDSPEKAQYSPSDIKALSGFDVGILTAPTAAQRAQARNEVLAWIREYAITEYADLVFYCFENENWLWLDYCETHTIFLRGVFDSIRHGGAMPKSG